MLMGESGKAEQESSGPWVPEGLHESTGFLLALAGAESRRRWTRGLARLGLRPAQYGALMILQRGAMPQQDLARALGIDPRNLVPIIDQLEGRGLLARRSDPADRRRHLVTLTSRGRESLRSVQLDGESIEREMLTPLSDSEQAVLKGLLRKLLPPLHGPEGGPELRAMSPGDK